MKRILALFFILTTCCFAETKFKPLTDTEKKNMDNFVESEVQNKTLWVNKYAVIGVGAPFKNEKYYMPKFEHFAQVKAIGVQTSDADCKKSINQICVYKAYFKDKKGNIEIMPILTLFESDNKKYKIFYSTVPVDEPTFTFFLTKDPN